MLGLSTKKELHLSILKTACLTGHRPSKLPWGYDETKESCIRFKENLKNTLAQAINYGIKNFLTGMAEGFDMIATEILIELRKQYKEISIIAIIPCKNQEKYWSPIQKERYHKILKCCDDYVILSDIYTPTCMIERNKYMVDKSSIVIACYNGQPSGTGKTINYALTSHCDVKIINPTHYK